MTDTARVSPTTAVPDFLDAAQNYDTRRLVQILDEARAAFGLGSTVDDLLLPSLRQVGSLWESGRAEVVAEEHLVTTATQVWLARLLGSMPPPTGERVLLTCGPHDLHTLSLECMAVLLAEQGADCRSLGARTPTATVMAVLRQIEPVAVVVVSHSAAAGRDAARTIEAVAAAGVDVYYAGAAFGDVQARAPLPGQWLGLRLAAAADLVIATSVG